jgi:hypothetical protein
MSVATIREYRSRFFCVDDDDGVPAKRRHLRQDTVEVTFLDVLEDIDIEKEIHLGLRETGKFWNGRIVSEELHGIVKFKRFQEPGLTASIVQDGVRA